MWWWLDPEQRPKRRDDRPRQQGHGPRRLRRAARLDALELDEGQRQLALGNQLGLETAAGAEPVRLDAEALELGRHRQSRKDMATSSTAGEKNVREILGWLQTCW